MSDMDENQPLPRDVPQAPPSPESGDGEGIDAAGIERLSRVLEALMMAAEEPLSLDRMQRLLGDELGANRRDLRLALERLDQALSERAVELREVAGGWRLQVRGEYSDWVSRLWKERPPRLSRALLETLALIIYRQPITRGEIEEIRGVSTSPNIIRTLFERGWIRELGVREVPGRPTLLGTTSQLLNDLNLKSLDQLPSLPEIKDPAQLEAALARLGANRDAAQLKGAIDELATEAQRGEAEAEAAAPTDEAGIPSVGALDDDAVTH